jgi:type II secretory pathway pseudopilin PulG
MTLVEIMVAMAIVAVITAIALPSISSVFDLEQRSVARELALTYRYLENEAILRNVTFRVVYNLDGRSWKIEVGDAGATTFGDPESREKYEEAQRDRLKLFTTKEIAAGDADADAHNRFSKLTAPGFETEVNLPSSCAFSYVYTPAYSEPVVPSAETPGPDQEARVAYSYVFPNGAAEYTMLRIVDIADPEDGYTLEVEPLSGVVNVTEENVEIGSSLSWLPDGAPEMR